MPEQYMPLIASRIALLVVFLSSLALAATSGSQFNCSNASDCSFSSGSGFWNCHYDNCTIEPIFQNATINYVINSTNTTQIVNVSVSCNESNITNAIAEKLQVINESMKQAWNFSQLYTETYTNWKACTNEFQTCYAQQNNSISLLNHTEIVSRLQANVTISTEKILEAESQRLYFLLGGLAIGYFVCSYINKRGEIQRTEKMTTQNYSQPINEAALREAKEKAMREGGA